MEPQVVRPSARSHSAVIDRGSVRSIRERWLTLGNPSGHLPVLAALVAPATTGWVTLSTRTTA
jgi:hypothetical protein